ncbi:PD-(D/E)XK nuclease family protein [Patescibacteria group bacterium]|nr:PD-(D/E)XK nuclease family protein [Patescibacteria group bacterium]
MKLQRSGKKIWLSHSGVDVLYRCPKCFWLRYKYKIYQPQGIVSRLPVRFDKIIKDYFNGYRIKGELPPIIKDQLKGQLQNPFQETYFYPINQKYGFFGKLDDCLITPEGNHAVIDFKTASSDPRKRDDIFPAYQRQLDEYTFLLKAKRKPIAENGYLIYFYPGDIQNLDQGVPMIIHIEKIKTNPQSVLPRLAEAIEVLEGKMPQSSDDCPYCQWHDDIKTLPVD